MNELDHISIQSIETREQRARDLKEFLHYLLKPYHYADENPAPADETVRAYSEEA